MIILFTCVGFVLGGILFSYHIPKFIKGVDIVACSEGHNPGAANAIKYAGRRVGMLCLLCDLAKGFFPVWFACRYVSIEQPLFCAVIVAPVFGHALAPLYRGIGGKTIATSFGVLAGLLPGSYAVLALIFWFVFSPPLRSFIRTRVASSFLFSVLAALFSPLFSLRTGYPCCWAASQSARSRFTKTGKRPPCPCFRKRNS